MASNSRALLRVALVVAAVGSMLSTAAFSHHTSVLPTDALNGHKETQDAAPVILVATSGLTWSDVSREGTPALWSLVEGGSTATMSTRSVNTNSCPIDGWLGLSAGARAAAPGPHGAGHPARRSNDPCPPIPSPTIHGGGSARIPESDTYLKSASTYRFDSRIGLLGQQFKDAGLCVAAVGPGAAIAAADRRGQLATYSAYDERRLTALLRQCPISIVDVGALRDEVAVGEATPDYSRDEQVTEIDAKIAQVMTAAPASSRLIVGSLADAGVKDRLHLAAAQGLYAPAGTLYSSSTRQVGLIQSGDLTVTLLAWSGLPVPTDLGGAVLRSRSAQETGLLTGEDRLAALIDYDQASHEVHTLVAPFFQGLVYSQIAFYALVFIVWRREWGSRAGRHRLLQAVYAVAIAAATVPVSTFLANLLPWWRYEHPMVAVVAAALLFVLPISAIAMLGPWRAHLLGAPTFVAVVTMVTIAADVMTGSRLQLSSLMGLQPVIGGRYYGMGNTTFALFATATMVACIAAADRALRSHGRRAAAVMIVVIGLAAVAIDGVPAWGADGGGPPALIPAIAFLALTLLGIRMTPVRMLQMAVATIGTFFAVAFLDSRRPIEAQSHLGRFFRAVLDGGASDIILRKGQQNFSILVSSQLTLLVPVALLFVIYVLARPTSWGSRSLARAFDISPVLRPGLIAVAIVLTIGFLVNDSGVAIPAVGATLIIPLLVAISARALSEGTSITPAVTEAL